MYSFKFVIVKKYVKAMVTFTNMKNIILIVKKIIYDMFYYFGKNLRFMYSTIIWNKSMVSLVIAIYTIHLLTYCDSIKMVGGNYSSPFKENIYTYKALP